MKNSKLKKALKSQAEQMEMKAIIAESEVRIHNALSQMGETQTNFNNMMSEDEIIPDSGPQEMYEALSNNYVSFANTNSATIPANGTILTTTEGSGYITLGSPQLMEAPQEAPNTKPREIRIVPLNRGYNVVVGCHTFAFEDHERMMKYITKYYENPSKTEQEWFSDKLFK